MKEVNLKLDNHRYMEHLHISNTESEDMVRINEILVNRDTELTYIETEMPVLSEEGFKELVKSVNFVMGWEA